MKTSNLPPDRLRAMALARDEWWSRIALKGDPIRRPNLTWEAFEEGYAAGLQASPGGELMEAAQALVSRWDTPWREGSPKVDDLVEALRQALLPQGDQT